MNANDIGRTVRELAVEIPGATRYFEDIGIDYCCGGGTSLDAACAARGIDAGEVLASLERLANAGDTRPDDPTTGSLGALADYVVETHHVYTREAVARIDRLFDKVCDAHGERRPVLHEMRAMFRAVADELGPHMLKEEQVLFPYIKRLERAAAAGEAPPAPFFVTVRNPIGRMRIEHDSAGAMLATLRALGDGYHPPEGACMTFRALYEALDELERDLHQHIHLENNVLFPKAVALEGEA
jgi:regulator of cell morphogenesis and NO signaling